MALKDRVVGHLVLEIALLEVGSLFLKLPQRVETALLEPKLAIPYQTAWAVPLVLGFGLQGRVQTGPVVGVITGFAYEKKSTFLFAFATMLALLIQVSILT
jgi:hypothetical protein